MDVSLLGSVQGWFSHQLLLRYQLQLFILMESVFKNLLSASVLVEAEWGGCGYPLLIGADVFPNHVCRDFAV